jgi:hypothetical protein
MPSTVVAGSFCYRRVTVGKLSYMNVVVCVKQIPDPADPGALDPTTKTLKRDGKLILDESDSYGVEMALQLVDAAGGGEVTLVSMAPNSEVAVCAPPWRWVRPRPCSSDDALAGTDALTTAKVLAKAIERAGDADLILAATESSDGYTGVVPEQIAELLVAAVGHLRQGDHHRRLHRQGAAPDRGRLRRGREPAARRGLRDRWCGRAPLPVVQGDHGREVQASRRGRSPTLVSTPPPSAGPAAARRSSRSHRPRPVRPEPSSRTTARLQPKIVDFLSELKVI